MFDLFLIYNPPLHLAVSSLSIAPLCCISYLCFSTLHSHSCSCTLSPTHGFLSSPGFTGPHAHMTRHRARLLPPTGSRPLHQAHAPSSRRDHPRLITARSLTTSSTSPPFRPGPAPAPRLGRPGLHNHVPTPDPAGRTRTGPGSSRPGLLPLRPRAMGLRGPGLHKTV